MFYNSVYGYLRMNLFRVEYSISHLTQVVQGLAVHQVDEETCNVGNDDIADVVAAMTLSLTIFRTVAASGSACV